MTVSNTAERPAAIEIKGNIGAARNIKASQTKTGKPEVKFTVGVRQADGSTVWAFVRAPGAVATAGDGAVVLASGEILRPGAFVRVWGPVETWTYEGKPFSSHVALRLNHLARKSAPAA